ncbi:MAG TPA: hypothetical protein DCP69_10155 [Candidatus Omnitrophica bacterium]|nr:hypothetical protein [Candidatus Omnitrophota bacterium]
MRATRKLHKVLNALAREVPPPVWNDAVTKILSEFTAERERCAQTCRDQKLPDNGDVYSTRAAFNDGCEACAEAIERGEG